MDPRTLLVVDDEPADVELIRRIAEDAVVPIDVVAAHSGAEALERAQARPPRLMLMDLVMPVMDGWEVVRRLKADPATRHIHVIAMTNYAMPGDREQALAAGCDDYIAKPIDVRQLRELLETYFG